MLLNRLVLVPLFLFPAAAAAEQASCPDNHAGARLTTVVLFDGPPSEHADLMPDKSRKLKNGGVESTWDVAYIFQAGRKLYVECQYGSSTSHVTVEPANVKICVFSNSNNRISLSCR